MSNATATANPFKAAREQLGLTVQAFSVRTRCSTTMIHMVEVGALGRPRKLVSALEDLGYNGDDLIQGYENFKRSLREQLAAG